MKSFLKRFRQLARAAGVALLLYTLTYVGLSAAGSYRRDMSGERRYAFGLALMDVDLWQPRWCYFRVYRDVRGSRSMGGNAMGLLFAPMILLDRATVHPTRTWSDALRERDEAPEAAPLQDS